MKILSHYKEIESYITRDGSSIRELMHPLTQGNQQQSLAEASIQPGLSTLLHKHINSEELYFITQGNGTMQLDNETFTINTGDCICIPAGTAHKVENTCEQELKILCCCSPAYSHDDTHLL